MSLLLTACGAPGLSGTKAIKADVEFETVNFTNLSSGVTQNAKDTMSKSNQTGLEVFEIIYNKDKEINQLFSPISLVYALAMVQNGAVGETRDQILDVLNYEKPLDNNAYNEVMNVFNHMEATSTDERPNATLKIGNSLWVREDLTPEQPFVDTLKSKYDAEVYKADFSLTETVEAMNKWVEDHTGGLLKETFKEFDPATVAALINTLYFKGTWRNEFSESRTVKMPFELNDGTKIDVDMMQNQGHFPYLETDSAQILSMGYHGDLRMLIYLPKNNVDDFFKDAEGRAVMLGSEKDSLTSSKVDVYFPKFDFQANNDLKEILKAMGMELPFEETMADFSELIVAPEGNVFISNIFQNARIIVDEKGTEAAAVTVVEMAATSAKPEPEETVEFKCDHPFVLVIQDSVTGANLFMGVVNNPSE
jgi:serpin B